VGWQIMCPATKFHSPQAPRPSIFVPVRAGVWYNQPGQILVLWTRLARLEREWEPLVRRIKERQNSDGGWSQAKDMASDAWATAQALYALAHAGIKSNDPGIARAHAFLIKRQREDGSWPMTSRPTTPGGKGSTSLIPITGAGSSWAILGLVRSR
jgi:Squalene-hopene cyclase N-terminal domain